MHRVSCGAAVENGTIRVSYEAGETWSRVPGVPLPLGVTSVLLGDAVRGPVAHLVYTPPGMQLDPAFAHTHASDNWRISLRGSFLMGRQEYGPGEYRLQRGWKTYPSDTVSTGPDGGWHLLVFADRRGTRIRPATPSPETEALTAVEPAFAETAGIRGDIFSDDPAETAGESELSTNLGPLSNSGHFNGTLADTEGWLSDGAGTLAGMALVGDPDCGPALVLVHMDAGAESSPQPLQTEMLRAAVAGSASADGDEIAVGDVRVYTAGTVPATRAGSAGYDEVLLVGDRRALRGLSCADRGWASLVPDLLASVAGALTPTPA